MINYGDWINTPSKRDYQEDFNLENGHYFKECNECKKMFLGHKRRPRICKVCLEKQKPKKERSNEAD